LERRGKEPCWETANKIQWGEEKLFRLRMRSGGGAQWKKIFFWKTDDWTGGGRGKRAGKEKMSRQGTSFA